MRLLIFDDKSQFLFSQPVPNWFAVKFCSHFLSSLFNNKKTDSDIKTTHIHDFEGRLCSQYTQQKRFLCLKWILKHLSTILHIQSNHYTLTVTPFNGEWNQWYNKRNEGFATNTDFAIPISLLSKAYNIGLQRYRD